ncbi:acyl carrier protein [Brevibacillus dissolubilis]|uniref:acyl carrier protein n=1 Tax=Brevibacillus dissolubilis TaxID=1844116 RepID=UPI001115F051|nr:acyl carrier protein [Brevibacillus dissolubilis]
MIKTEQLVELLCDILDIEEDFTHETELEQLEGWDSVNALRVLTNIESEFGVRISMEDFSKVKTVSDLASLVG